MIITRSPMRISFGGGGTDLPSYYKKYGGYVVSAAINKYVYVALNYSFHDELILKYSRMETVKSVDNIKHPIIRECFHHLNINPSHLELAFFADIPGGTGMGSSSAFTCALLSALHTYKHECVKPNVLADESFSVENSISPLGKQDQYISSYGGMKEFFFENEGVRVAHLNLPVPVINDLDENLLLFFTGYTRPAKDILKEQNQRAEELATDLTIVKQIGYQITDALRIGSMAKFSSLMNAHWVLKKKRSQNMTNDVIDNAFTAALQNGALGGRLLGAGGGGFLVFYSEDHNTLRHKMFELGLEEVRFRFDKWGTKVVES
jgi:D-glycero-alpha-D-manno-heptose-7-phosphate kinase